MYKSLFKIDEEGFFIEQILIREGDELPKDCVDVFPTTGLYKQKWVDGEWVEGATIEEIEHINRPRPLELSPLELLGQQVTEQEISDIEQWHNVTELELQAMEQGQQITDMQIEQMIQGQGADRTGFAPIRIGGEVKCLRA